MKERLHPKMKEGEDLMRRCCLNGLDPNVLEIKQVVLLGSIVYALCGTAYRRGAHAGM